MFVLLFTAPNFSASGKIAYAFVTYIIYSLAWTIVQIPQLALPAMLTNDLAKRTRIQAIFQAFGSIAALVVIIRKIPHTVKPILSLCRFFSLCLSTHPLTSLIDLLSAKANFYGLNEEEVQIFFQPFDSGWGAKGAAYFAISKLFLEC